MIKITSIELRGGYRLLLRFSDGSQGERDFSDLVAENGSLAKPLRDAAYFARAFTEDGSGLAWPNGLDLDAEALHDEMKAAGLLGMSAA
jgi:hypothetical protein